MKNLPKLISIQFALAVAVALAASTVSSQAQIESATATISGVAAGGNFDYTITLKNTGAGSLNAFWYGWTQSGNNMAVDPSNAGNSRGWDNDLDANSIMWINTTGTGLAPGQSGTFTFVSSTSPSAITTAPSGESVAYVGGIDFSQGAAGDSTGAFSPTLVAAPEPASLSLMVVGAIGGLVAARRKARA